MFTEARQHVLAPATDQERWGVASSSRGRQQVGSRPNARASIVRAQAILTELGRMGDGEAAAVLRAYARANALSVQSAAEAVIVAYADNFVGE